MLTMNETTIINGKLWDLFLR